MSESYEVDLMFEKENMPDSDLDQFLEEVERLEEEIEIKAREGDRQIAQLSDPATVTALNAAVLAVHGTDLLITLYQIARAQSSFVRASIRDENGEEVQVLSEDHIEAGSIEDNVIIGSIEGDVYFVNESDVDWMDIAQGSTKDGEED